MKSTSNFHPQRYKKFRKTMQNGIEDSIDFSKNYSFNLWLVFFQWYSSIGIKGPRQKAQRVRPIPWGALDPPVSLLTLVKSMLAIVHLQTSKEREKYPWSSVMAENKEVIFGHRKFLTIIDRQDFKRKWLIMTVVTYLKSIHIKSAKVGTYNTKSNNNSCS